MAWKLYRIYWHPYTGGVTSLIRARTQEEAERKLGDKEDVLEIEHVEIVKKKIQPRKKHTVNKGER